MWMALRMSLPITVTAHIVMGAVISLPWDVLQGPLAVSHLERQSLLGPMCYLVHAGVALVLVGAIMSNHSDWFCMAGVLKIRLFFWLCSLLMSLF